MRRTDILDDPEDRAALVAHVAAERDGAATDSAAFVDDDVAEHRGRGAVDVAVDVEVATNHHH